MVEDDIINGLYDSFDKAKALIAEFGVPYIDYRTYQTKSIVVKF